MMSGRAARCEQMRGRGIDLLARRPAAAEARPRIGPPRAWWFPPARRAGFPSTRGAGGRCETTPGIAAGDRARPPRRAPTRAMPNTPAASARLIVQFVQHPPLLGERGAHRRARDDQQGHGVRISLGHRRHDVGEPRARDHEGGRRTAAQAGEAIRGKSCALFVAHQHVAHVGRRQAAVQLQVVHAGNTEYRVDAVLGQEFDEITADIARHWNLLEFERLSSRTCSACGRLLGLRTAIG